MPMWKIYIASEVRASRELSIKNEQNKTHPLRKLKVAFAELTYEDLNDCEKTLYMKSYEQQR